MSERKRPDNSRLPKGRRPYRVEAYPADGRHPKCVVCGRAAVRKTNRGAWIPFCPDCRGTVGEVTEAPWGE